ncbi:MAG: exosortase/archaeosortase family protein [Verrucomicrobiota bacterium]
MSDSDSNLRFLDLSKERLAALFMLLGFAAFMIWDQSYWWSEREDYSFGYLVPLFALYVLYDRWPVIQSYLTKGEKPDAKVSSPATGQSWVRLLEGLAMVVFLVSVSLFAVGSLLRSVTGPQNPATLAISAGFSGLMLSTVFIFAKERLDGQPMSLKARISFTLLFLFPAIIWLLSAPLVSVLETKIRVFLLTKVTMVVFGVLDFLQYDIQREGNVLILNDQDRVGVEEACSGIRSLTACLFAGSFLASVFLNRFWKKIALVGVAMFLAVFTNLIRSFFLTFWAYQNGSVSIDEPLVLPLLGDVGSVHDATGMAILGVTCVGLICLLPIFNYKLPEFEEDVVTSVPDSKP